MSLARILKVRCAFSHARAWTAVGRLFLLATIFVLGGCSDERQQTTGRAGMRADMPDEQLLQVLKRDPAKMTRKLTQGDDGTSITYTDAEEEIEVTRSVVSGVVVLRHIHRNNVWQTWVLGK